MDWEKIKLEYITTDVSYRELSDKYEVSLSSLSKTAVRDKWSKQREKHRKKIATKVQQKIVNKKVRELEKEIGIAEAISDILQAAVSHPGQFLKMCEDGSGEKYSFERISEALDALSKLEKSKRSLYGILSEKEKAAIELSREKIDIAKSRIGVGGDLAESGVVLLPPVYVESSQTENKSDEKDGS